LDPPEERNDHRSIVSESNAGTEDGTMGCWDDGMLE
jgi:hypothetical protein